ncbi:MAG TPA: glycosyltransferase, partial [Caulobacteraceae bacterium]
MDCLVAQTFAAWEAIVVDDASTDDTAAIARRYADADPRIQLVGQARGGASAARNRGMAHARAAWLLFLDADDWVAADFMEKMLAAARRKPGAGAVYCAYNRVSPDGRRLAQDWYEDLAKAPFASFARGCPPAIHSVIARRDLVVEVGGFDPSLMTCEDWDIWQKIARTGARFVELPETLAFYRMRPGSLSMQTAQMLKDGLTVSSRARGPDPRVPRPHPAFANGVPSGATEG